MKFSVLTYNIHKGFQHTRRKRVLHWMRDAIAESGADLVFLQEVMGFETAVQASQLEFLADTLWPHTAYGRNSVTTFGHHGNALLSRFPILSSENLDISSNALERRGVLHAEIQVPGFGDLHALSLHLGLLEADRRSQVRRVCHRIHRKVHRGTPLIIGGDFNDWRERASPDLHEAPLDLRGPPGPNGLARKNLPSMDAGAQAGPNLFSGSEGRRLPRTPRTAVDAPVRPPATSGGF